MSSRKPLVSIRRAPAANPALVEQFVANGVSEPAPPAPSATEGSAPEPLDARTSDPLDTPVPERSGSRAAERLGVPPLGPSATRAPERAEPQPPERPGGQVAGSPEGPTPEHPRARDLERPGAGEPGGAGGQAPGNPAAQAAEPSALQVPERPGVHTSGGSAAQVAGSLGVQTPAKETPARRPKLSQEPAAAPPTPAATRRGLVHRQDGRVRRRMTVYLPPELVGKLAALCVYDGRELSDAIADAVRTYLERS